MANRIVPSNEFLLAFSGEHLAYELEMFYVTAAEILIPAQPYSGSIRNALLESFTTHARSMLFFFYPAKIQPDDALASDFLKPELSWELIRPPLSDALRQVRTRVGKEITHLTYSRANLTTEQKLWKFPQIMLEFSPILQVFVSNSCPTKLHDRCLEVGNFWMRLFVEKGIYKLGPPA